MIVALLAWVVGLWATSALAFLIARPVFRAWPDQGYGLAKVSGPLWVGLGTYVLHAWTGWSWSPALAWGAAAVLAALAAAITARSSRIVVPWRRLLVVDVAWLLCGVAFLALRGSSPSMVGTERPMDHALLAAARLARHLPPIDPWFAGHAVNYHYGGHAFWTPITWLCAVPPGLAYNVVLTTIPAQAFAAALSLGARLDARAWWWGGAGLVLGTPPAALVLIARGHDVVDVLWRTTRVLPGTIDEYPLFSFTWGDLHAHVIAIPVLVAAAAWLVRLMEDEVGVSSPGARLGLSVGAGVMTVAPLLISTWDAAAIAVGLVIVSFHTAWRHETRVLARQWAPGLVVAGIVAWPMLSAFHPPPVRWGLEAAGSDPWRFLALHAVWLWPVLALGLLHAHRRPWLMATLAAVLVGLGVGAPHLAIRAGLLVAIGLVVAARPLAPSARGLLLWGLAMWLLAETIWIDDVYGWEARRMNTVFKWHLHATILTALTWPAVWAALRDTRRAGTPVPRWGRELVAGVAGLTLAAASVTMGGLWQRREPGWTLDVLASLAREAPGEAAIVRYLWTHGAPGDVVLEAPGEPYTPTSRISALTGLPTLVGWAGHEVLWRRGEAWGRRVVARRAAADAIYGGPASGVPARLAAERVRFIVIGANERRAFPRLDRHRFDGMTDTVFEGRDAVLLRVR